MFVFHFYSVVCQGPIKASNAQVKEEEEELRDKSLVIFCVCVCVSVDCSGHRRGLLIIS